MIYLEDDDNPLALSKRQIKYENRKLARLKKFYEVISLKVEEEYNLLFDSPVYICMPPEEAELSFIRNNKCLLKEIIEYRIVVVYTQMAIRTSKD